MAFVYKADPVRGVCRESAGHPVSQPLPANHQLWSHPKVLLTPDIASMTQPETAVELVLDNIRRHQAGAPLVGLVDRTRRY
jgi:glyoxylate/hydroxypyruvate reductase A